MDDVRAILGMIFGTLAVVTVALVGIMLFHGKAVSAGQEFQ